MLHTKLLIKDGWVLSGSVYEWRDSLTVNRSTEVLRYGVGERERGRGSQTVLFYRLWKLEERKEKVLRTPCTQVPEACLTIPFFCSRSLIWYTGSRVPCLPDHWLSCPGGRVASGIFFVCCHGSCSDHDTWKRSSSHPWNYVWTC